ncbi:DUF6443 domain-containing protein, partial [Hyunsoonleella pacifica]
MFTRKNKIKLIQVFVLYLIVNAFAFAQNPQEFSSTSIIPETTLSNSAYELETTGVLDVDVYSYVNLSIKENTAPYDAYKFSITLTVSPLLPDGTPDSDYTITLEVENNLTAGVGNITDLKQHILENKYISSVYISSISFEDIQSGVSDNTTVPENIQLSIGYNKTRYYELSPDAPTITTSSTPISEGELTISWDEIPEARYYDVEWTWVDNYGDNITIPLDKSIIYFNVKDFERNSTRIQTNSLSYNIPVVYSQGYILYRVRAVGNFLDDITKNKYSRWTRDTQDEQNDKTEAEANNTSISRFAITHWPHKVEITEDHASGKNWQFQSSFAEDGKKKEVVSYFDGSLRNRQTVTKINTDNTAVVGEVVYDAQGRPAVEVLPVPTTDNELKYHNGQNQEGAFNLNSSGIPYSYLDFDLNSQNEGNSISDSKKMSIALGASKYYSPDNTDFSGLERDRIPDASQFPFSQIEYTPDNTGRIRRKSGVGKAHQLNSGHEMEYFYGIPEQEELNRLFGYAIGNTSHYKKNMVLDPNGQLSISYIDPQGRTIATALAGDKIESNSLISLEDEQNDDLHEEFTIDLLNKENNNLNASGNFNTLQDERYYFGVKTVAFDAPRKFSYGVTASPFTYDCVTDFETEPNTTLSQAYDITYDLNINIFDENATNLFSLDTKSNIPENHIVIDQANKTYSYTDENGNFPEITIDRGTFTITKSLKVNKAAAEEAANLYIAKLQDENDDCYVSPDIISPPPIIIDGCFTTCEECITAITTEYPSAIDYANEMLQQYPINEQTEELTNTFIAQYNEAIIACNAPCNDADPTITPGEDPLESISCQSAKDQLLQDMSPLGQYGNGVNTNNPETILNIFNESNQLYSARTSDSGTYNSWKNPYHPEYDGARPNPSQGLYTSGNYYNEDGSISEIKVEIIETIDENDVVTVSYQPEIDDTAISTLRPTDDVDISNKYWVKPQYLSNHIDFVRLWQDSWAESLIVYHPEYDYLLYVNELCTIQRNSALGTFNSDGFDAYLQSIVTFDEADQAGYFLNTISDFILYDPYFSQFQLSSDLQASSDYMSSFLSKDGMMETALTQDYNNTNAAMVYSAYANITFSSLDNKTISDIKLTHTFDQILNEVRALDDSKKKDKFWNVYKANYLGLKQQIQSVFINAYAQEKNAYNGCIGQSAVPTDLINNLTEGYTTSSTRNYLNTLNPSNGICSDTNSGAYITKQKRFLPSDMFYNAGADPKDVVNDIAEQVNYNYYVNTGVCPLARDLQIYLDGYFKESANIGVEGRNYQGQYLSPKLYEALGGVVNNPSTSGIIISEKEFRLSIDGVTDSEVTIIIPTSSTYSWNDYASTWEILSITQINATQIDDTTYSYKALAKLNEEGTEDIIISGTTKVRISNCDIDPSVIAEGGEYLGPGSTYDETGSCNKQTYFEKALKTLMNGLIETNQLNIEGSIDITNLQIYSEGYLPEFFGYPQTMIWKSDGGSQIELEADGVSVMYMALYTDLPNENAYCNDVRFEYIYDENTITSQEIKTTWFDFNNDEELIVDGQVYDDDNNENPNLINFLCCDDINNYTTTIDPDPLPCSSVLLADGTFESQGEICHQGCVTNSGCGMSFGGGYAATSGEWTKEYNTTHFLLLSNDLFSENECSDYTVQFQSSTCTDLCMVPPTGAQNGGEYFYVTRIIGSGGKAAIKTLLTDLVVGKTYTVSFDQSGIRPGENSRCCGGISATSSTVYFGDQSAPGGKVIVVSDANAHDNDNTNNNVWEHFSTTFVANSTTAELKIEADFDYNGCTPSHGAPIIYVGLDNIKVFADQDGDGIGDDCDPVDNSTICNAGDPAIQFGEDLKNLLNKIIANNNFTDEGVSITNLPEYQSQTFQNFVDINAAGVYCSLVGSSNPNYTTYNYQGITDAEYYYSSGLQNNTYNDDISIHFNSSATDYRDKLYIFLDIDITKKEYITEFIDILPVKSSGETATQSTLYARLTYKYVINETEYQFEEITKLIRGKLLNDSDALQGFGLDYHCNLRDLNSCENQSNLAFASQSLALAAQTICDKPCVAQPLKPVSSMEKYQVYLDILQSVGIDTSPANEGVTYISKEDFSSYNYAYITEDYKYYIDTVVIPTTTAQDESPSTSLNYISIGDFGATDFGYGYDDPDDGRVGMQGIIDEYLNTHLNDNNISFDDKKTWMQFASDHYYQLTDQGNSCISLPPLLPVDFNDVYYPAPKESSCERFTENIKNTYGKNNYEEFLRKEREKFLNAYLRHATENVEEEFKMIYQDKEYQYTLYYYDQAGNLKQTVPPQGVKRFSKEQLEAIADVDGVSLSLNDRINKYRKDNPINEDIELLPNHEYKTQYKYNSLNQLVWQSTPDGGITCFAYDDLGRIIASQNAKQKDNNTFSYTTYDDLGRIIEAGELVPNVDVAINNTTGKLVYTSNDSYVEFLIEVTEPDNTITKTRYPDNITSEKHEVTQTVYTEYSIDENQVFKTAGIADINQTSRNRVTEIYYFDEKLPSTSNVDFNHAIYYNYDIHGNVKEMVTHNKLLAKSSNQYSGLKHVEYEYDLISGNVNKVYYQKGLADQFIHKYEYDADNRIVNVQTSTDGFIWETDASYNYFAHGPLARTVLGDKEVQGMDYAYTLQGWLKGVNSNQLDPTKDLGTDGTVGSNVAQDAMGFALTYYGNNTNNITDENDYASIGSINAFLDIDNTAANNVRNLYNGNIKQMSTDIADMNETALGAQINDYTYDQLNRIKSMQGYLGGTANYSGVYEYDKNGNLKTLKRKADQGQNMDDLEYFYKDITEADGTIRKTNQLDYVNDLEEDIGLNDLGEQTPGNYEYDKIGQLTFDRAEGINNIEWRVDGKVASIEKADGTEIHFKYDGLGNRIAKTVLPENKTTVYSRDAQGNVLAVYETNEYDITNITNSKYIALKEHHIYGSSRLGIEEKNILLEDDGSSGIVLENITLSDQNITSAQQYRAELDIETNNYTINSGVNVIMKAGNSIVFKPGTTILSGSNLTARIEPITATLPEDMLARIVGDKRYELSNHLGNVLTVISDRKLVDDPLNFTNFTADVLSYNDYYPFG